MALNLKRMPLPLLGGIRGGDMCYTLIERPISKRGETTHVPPLEFYIDRFVENHKRKF